MFFSVLLVQYQVMLIFRYRGASVGALQFLNFKPRFIQVATITGRGTRGKPLTLQKPFPYEEKKFNFFHSLFDNTMLRVCEENAKIIVVDGPIAVGKTSFATALAEELDMRYYPQITMDVEYILPDGFDLRQLDPMLPKSARTYDHKNFCLDPKNPDAALLQYNMLVYKFQQYVDALAHILNTGQGVILERSFLGDVFFMKAMRDHKYMSKEAGTLYFETYCLLKRHFPAPHLIIYLDIPVPVVQERIRARNYSYEQNSPALTKEYLTSLEKYWKQEYLKLASDNTEILVYDWTEGGEVELVIDDIERIDFNWWRRDEKFRLWRMPRKELYTLRKTVTNKKESFDFDTYCYYWEAPEFNYKREDLLKREKLYSELPGCKYDIGYNRLTGDKFWNILFKTKMENYRRNRNFLNYYYDKTNPEEY